MQNDPEVKAKLSAKLLFAATLCTLICSNSAANQWYTKLLNYPILGFAFNFQEMINNGLMAIFFLCVAFEIKYELIQGALNSRKKAALPFIAACGGMLMPILIYMGFTFDNQVALRGFAIPTATDIAFSLSIIAFLGARVRSPVKIFLLTLAVLDDLLAIILIAVFYTSTISISYLISSGIILSVFALLNYLHVSKLSPYLLLGTVLWYCLLKAGIHPTLAGVATAFAIPLRTSATSSNKSLPGKLQSLLNPYVMFFILPLFAFANAGVSIISLQLNQLHLAIMAGIFFGLILGKPLGIFFSSWFAIRYDIAKLPADFSMTELAAVSVVCGIGFTISLFIGTLAFHEMNPEYIASVKIAVLSGSLLSGMVGYILLKRASAKT